MKKTVFFVLLNLILALSFAKNKEKITEIPYSSSLIPEKNSYVMYISPYDWGAAADKIVICTDEKFEEEQIKPEDFEVNRLVSSKNKVSKGYGLGTGEWPVKKAYLSDGNGNRVEKRSRYITLELDVAPWNENNPFLSSGNVYGLKIENDPLEFVIRQRTGIVSQSASLFSVSKYECEESEVDYLYWETEKKAEKTPLIVWFHGSEEGGDNIYKTVLNAKVDNLVKDDVQKYFEDGACVLVPHVTDSWLLTVQKNSLGMHLWEPADIQGTKKKVFKPFYAAKNALSSNDGKEDDAKKTYATVSLYTQIIHDLIEDFAEAHPYIDTDRIYLMGASSGGYMVMNMILQYPQMFAAGVPLSEAYVDNKISDSQIEVLASVPLWFVVCKNDDVLDYKKYSMGTIERIEDIDNARMNYTLYDDVYDTSGLYTDKKGKPFVYDGHFTWIYMLNDEVENDGVKLFDWLSRQKK